MLRDEEQREVDSIIYKEGKIYIPKDEKLRAEIIQLHHDMPVGGHRGQQKIVELVTRNFWWPGIMKEVKLSIAFHPQTDRQKERVNQELEQYLRMFIDHRQGQQPDWLETAEFAYNNKVHLSTKTLPFKANYGQNPRMGFEIRKKGKYCYQQTVNILSDHPRWMFKKNSMDVITKS